MEKFPCPNCKNDHNTLRRYKDAVCRTCIDIYGTKTKEGISKYFFNMIERRLHHRLQNIYLGVCRKKNF